VRAPTEMAAACTRWDQRPHNSTLLRTNNQSNSPRAYYQRVNFEVAPQWQRVNFTTAVPLKPWLHGRRRSVGDDNELTLPPPCLWSPCRSKTSTASPRNEAIRIGNGAIPCSNNNSGQSRTPFQVIHDAAAAPVEATPDNTTSTSLGFTQALHHGHHW
jgi:hypothetical protein